MARNLLSVTDELQVNRLDPIPRLTPPTANGLLGNQIFPEITSLDNGNFVVVYQNDAGGAGDQDIMSIEFSANGQPVGTPFRVDFDAGDQGAPDVTHRVGGGFAAVWADDGATQTDIHMVVVTTGTPTNPPEFTVADFADDLEGPVIGTFANGNYIVAYQRESPGSDDIWFAIVNASGTAWVVPNTGLVTTAGLDEGQQRLATSGDTAAIVYRQGDTSSDIKLNLISSTGNGLDFQTVADGAAPNGLPDIATLADGRFVIVWSQAAASFDLRVASTIPQPSPSREKPFRSRRAAMTSSSAASSDFQMADSSSPGLMRGLLRGTTLRSTPGGSTPAARRRVTTSSSQKAR